MGGIFEAKSWLSGALGSWVSGGCGGGVETGVFLMRMVAQKNKLVDGREREDNKGTELCGEARGAATSATPYAKGRHFVGLLWGGEGPRLPPFVSFSSPLNQFGDNVLSHSCGVREGPRSSLQRRCVVGEARERGGGVWQLSRKRRRAEAAVWAWEGEERKEKEREREVENTETKKKKTERRAERGRKNEEKDGGERCYG